MSKNALVYTISQPLYNYCAANSINSFYANNPQWLLDDTEVFIITDIQNAQKNVCVFLYENIKYTIIDQPSYDYPSAKLNANDEQAKRCQMMRLEILHNPVFRNFTNVVLFDSETVIEKPIDELFVDDMAPGIYTTIETFTKSKDGFINGQTIFNRGRVPISGVVLMHQPHKIGDGVLDGLFNEMLRVVEERNMQPVPQDVYYAMMDNSSFNGVFHELDACHGFSNYAADDGSNVRKIQHHACSRGRYHKSYAKFVLPKSRTDVPSIYSICEKKIPVMLHQGLTSGCPMGNSTIIPYKNNSMYLCGFREFTYGMYENYRSWSHKRYASIYKNSTKINYYFSLLNNSFQPHKRRYNDLIVPRMPDSESTIEDGRLVWWDGKLYLMGCEVSKRDPMNTTVSLFSVEDKDWKITLDFVYNSKGMFTGRQKNWMPIPDKPFNVVFNVGEKTTTIVDMNAKTTYDVPHKIDCCHPNLRGNTPLMRMGDKYITIVHTAVDKEYNHYICVFDDGLHLEHISRRFVFDKFFPVEFVINMFHQNHTNNIGMSVTEMDSFQYVYLVDKSKFLEFAYN